MKQANNYVSKSTVAKLKAHPFSQDAIIFAKVGAAILHERKRIAQSPFLIDNNMMAFTPKEHEDIDFIYHLFQKLKLSKYVQVGALPSYNASDILDIRTFYPASCIERSKIVAFLNLLSMRIEKQTEILSCLKKYKRGLLSFMFEEITVIDEAASTTYLFAEIALRRKEKYNPECGVEYPCVELEHIEQATGQILGTVSSTAQNSIKTVAKPGDVLFSKLRPYLRKFAFVERDMVCSSEIWAFMPTIHVLPKYLYYLIQTEHFLRVANISSGTKMPRAEWANIEKEEFDIPCPAVQAQTVTVLEAIDKKIALADKTLLALSQIKVGLLQQLFI